MLPSALEKIIITFLTDSGKHPTPWKAVEVEEFYYYRIEDADGELVDITKNEAAKELVEWVNERTRYLRDDEAADR